MYDHMKERRQVKVLTSVVLRLREVRDISHNGLSLDKKEVEPKLSTTLVVCIERETLLGLFPHAI